MDGRLIAAPTGSRLPTRCALEGKAPSVWPEASQLPPRGEPRGCASRECAGGQGGGPYDWPQKASSMPTETPQVNRALKSASSETTFAVR